MGETNVNRGIHWFIELLVVALLLMKQGLLLVLRSSPIMCLGASSGCATGCLDLRASVSHMANDLPYKTIFKQDRHVVRSSVPIISHHVVCLCLRRL